MFPYLVSFTINGHLFRVPTYGLLLSIAFSSAYFWSLRRALKLNESPKHIENLFLLVILGAILGGRLFHVFFEEFDYYLHHLGKIFAVWEGGYTFYGAVMGAALAMYGYAKWAKLDYLQFVDIATPSVMLGLFIGRWACFFAGCCWGKPCPIPWLGVTFSHKDSFTSAHDIALHPSQLYESFGALFILFYLERVFARRRFPGQVFFTGLIGYALLRFVVEFFRGDEYRGYVFDGLLSYSQLVSLVIIPFALSGMIIYSARSSQSKK